MSSLLSVLQEWLRNDRTRHPQYIHQDYDNLVKLIGEYQHTMNEYQSNMSTYLLLLASLQSQLLSSSTTESPREENTFTFSTSNPTTTNEQTNTHPQRQRARVYPRSSTRQTGNRTYASTATSSNLLNQLRPLMTRYHTTQNNRVSDSIFSSPNGNETSRLFDSLVRENRGNTIDVCGNSLFGNIETTENRWNHLFPPLSSSTGLNNGSGSSVLRMTENIGNSEPSNNPVNLIDIVFEYDDQFQQFNNPDGEATLQRMVQNDDFRNQILRAAGLENRTNIMRWIVAPNGIDDSEQNGLSNEEIRVCTESLIYEEGLEGLLSNICPITMEEYVVGDRLLQLRECRHAFRERELVEWFQRHSTCPVCRTSYGG